MGKGRAALTVVAVAVGLVMSQQITLSVVLPQLAMSLHASQTGLQWILDAYPIGLAALLLTGGALGDRYGRRRMLLLGLVGMAATNVALALCHSVGAAIAWRGVCSVAAAVTFPATLSTLTASFPSQRRSRAVAVWASGAILGGFVGVFAAGGLVEFWSWRSICWATAIASAALIPAVAVFVPESAAPEEAVLDAVSSVTAVLGVGGVTYAIISAGEYGIADVRVLAGGAAGVLMCVLFGLRQLTMRRPMLNLRALAPPAVGIGLIGTTALYFAVYGSIYVSVQYLSVVRGQSTLRLGITVLSYAALLLPATALSTRVMRRFGSGPLIVTGLLTIGAGDLAHTRLTATSGIGGYLIAAVVTGAGVGLAQVPATDAIVRALPASEQGLASAVSDLTREIGAALGIAVAGAVLSAHLGHRGGPTQIFMAGWSPTFYALALACAGCAATVLAIAIRAGRRSPRGRHAAALPGPVRHKAPAAH
jgi:MFS family permease